MLLGLFCFEADLSAIQRDTKRSTRLPPRVGNGIIVVKTNGKYIRLCSQDAGKNLSVGRTA